MQSIKSATNKSAKLRMGSMQMLNRNQSSSQLGKPKHLRQMTKNAQPVKATLGDLN